MKEQLKNLLLGSVGLAIYAKEAVEEIGKKLVEKGKLSEKEMADFSEDVKKHIQDKIHEVAKAAEERTRPPVKKAEDTKPTPKKDKTKSKP